MMTSERENFLTTQFVWAIQSDRTWYDDIQRWDRDQFSPFSTETGKAVIRIQNLLRKSGDYTKQQVNLNPGERAFIDLTLWEWDGRDIHGKSHVLMRVKNVLTEYLRDTEDHEGLKQEIDQHQENAANFFAKAEAELKRIEQENQMSQIAFQTKSFVFGTDVAIMNEEQLIDAIKKIEAEIANLGTVKTKSKKLDAKKAELTAMLANVVEILDAK